MSKSVLFIWNEFLLSPENDGFKRTIKNVLSHINLNYELPFKEYSQSMESNECNILWTSEFNEIQLLLRPTYHNVVSTINKIFSNRNFLEIHLIYIGMTINDSLNYWIFPDGIFSTSSMENLLSNIRQIIPEKMSKIIYIHLNEKSKNWTEFTTKNNDDKDFNFVINFKFNDYEKSKMEKENLDFISNIEDLIVNSMNQNYLQSPSEILSIDNNIMSNNPNQINLLVSKELMGFSSLLSVGGFNLVIDCPNFTSPLCYRYFKDLPKIDTFLLTSWNLKNSFGFYNMLESNQMSSIGYFILPQANQKPYRKSDESQNNLFSVDMRNIINDIMVNVKRSDSSVSQPLADMKKSYKLFYKLGAGTLQMFCIFPPTKDLYKPLKSLYDAWDNNKETSTFEKLLCDSSMACLLIWNSDDKQKPLRILVSSSCHEITLIKSLVNFSKTDSLLNAFNENKSTDSKDNKSNRFEILSKAKAIELERSAQLKKLTQSPQKSLTRMTSEINKSIKKTPMTPRSKTVERPKPDPIVQKSTIKIKPKKTGIEEINKMKPMKASKEVSRSIENVKLIECKSKELSSDNITNEDTLTNIGSMEILGGVEEFTYVSDLDIINNKTEINEGKFVNCDLVENQKNLKSVKDPEKHKINMDIQEILENSKQNSKENYPEFCEQGIEVDNPIENLIKNISEIIDKEDGKATNLVEENIMSNKIDSKVINENTAEQIQNTDNNLVEKVENLISNINVPKINDIIENKSLETSKENSSKISTETEQLEIIDYPEENLETKRNNEQKKTKSEDDNMKNLESFEEIENEKPRNDKLVEEIETNHESEEFEVIEKIDEATAEKEKEETFIDDNKVTLKTCMIESEVHETADIDVDEASVHNELIMKDLDEVNPNKQYILESVKLSILENETNKIINASIESEIIEKVNQSWAIIDEPNTILANKTLSQIAENFQEIKNFDKETRDKLESAQNKDNELNIDENPMLKDKETEENIDDIKIETEDEIIKGEREISKNDLVVEKNEPSLKNTISVTQEIVKYDDKPHATEDLLEKIENEILSADKKIKVNVEIDSNNDNDGKFTINRENEINKENIESLDIKDTPLENKNLLNDFPIEITENDSETTQHAEKTEINEDLVKYSIITLELTDKSEDKIETEIKLHDDNLIEKDKETNEDEIPIHSTIKDIAESEHVVKVDLSDFDENIQLENNRNKVIENTENDFLLENLTNEMKEINDNEILKESENEKLNIMDHKEMADELEMTGLSENQSISTSSTDKEESKNNKKKEESSCTEITDDYLPYENKDYKDAESDAKKNKTDNFESTEKDLVKDERLKQIEEFKTNEIEPETNEILNDNKDDQLNEIKSNKVVDEKPEIEMENSNINNKDEFIQVEEREIIDICNNEMEFGKSDDIDIVDRNEIKDFQDEISMVEISSQKLEDKIEIKEIVIDNLNVEIDEENLTNKTMDTKKFENLEISEIHQEKIVSHNKYKPIFDLNDKMAEDIELENLNNENTEEAIEIIKKIDDGDKSLENITETSNDKSKLEIPTNKESEKLELKDDIKIHAEQFHKDNVEIEAKNNETIKETVEKDKYESKCDAANEKDKSIVKGTVYREIEIIEVIENKQENVKATQDTEIDTVKNEEMEDSFNKMEVLTEEIIPSVSLKECEEDINEEVNDKESIDILTKEDLILESDGDKGRHYMKLDDNEIIIENEVVASAEHDLPVTDSTTDVEKQKDNLKQAVKNDFEVIIDETLKNDKEDIEFEVVDGNATVKNKELISRDEYKSSNEGASVHKLIDKDRTNPNSKVQEKQDINIDQVQLTNNENMQAKSINNTIEVVNKLDESVLEHSIDERKTSTKSVQEESDIDVVTDKDQKEFEDNVYKAIVNDEVVENVPMKLEDNLIYIAKELKQEKNENESFDNKNLKTEGKIIEENEDNKSIVDEDSDKNENLIFPLNEAVVSIESLLDKENENVVFGESEKTYTIFDENIILQSKEKEFNNQIEKTITDDEHKIDKVSVNIKNESSDDLIVEENLQNIELIDTNKNIAEIITEQSTLENEDNVSKTIDENETIKDKNEKNEIENLIDNEHEKKSYDLAIEEHKNVNLEIVSNEIEKSNEDYEESEMKLDISNEVSETVIQSVENKLESKIDLDKNNDKVKNDAFVEEYKNKSVDEIIQEINKNESIHENLEEGDEKKTILTAENKEISKVTSDEIVLKEGIDSNETDNYSNIEKKRDDENETHNINNEISILGEFYYKDKENLKSEEDQNDRIKFLEKEADELLQTIENDRSVGQEKSCEDLFKEDEIDEVDHSELSVQSKIDCIDNIVVNEGLEKRLNETDDSKNIKSPEERCIYENIKDKEKEISEFEIKQHNDVKVCNDAIERECENDENNVETIDNKSKEYEGIVRDHNLIIEKSDDENNEKIISEQMQKYDEKVIAEPEEKQKELETKINDNKIITEQPENTDTKNDNSSLVQVSIEKKQEKDDSEIMMDIIVKKDEDRVSEITIESEITKYEKENVEVESEIDIINQQNKFAVKRSDNEEKITKSEYKLMYDSEPKNDDVGIEKESYFELTDNMLHACNENNSNKDSRNEKEETIETKKFRIETEPLKTNNLKSTNDEGNEDCIQDEVQNVSDVVLLEEKNFHKELINQIDNPVSEKEDKNKTESKDDTILNEEVDNLILQNPEFGDVEIRKESAVENKLTLESTTLKDKSILDDLENNEIIVHAIELIKDKKEIFEMGSEINDTKNLGETALRNLVSNEENNELNEREKTDPIELELKRNENIKSEETTEDDAIKDKTNIIEGYDLQNEPENEVDKSLLKCSHELDLEFEDTVENLRNDRIKVLGESEVDNETIKEIDNNTVISNKNEIQHNNLVKNDHNENSEDKLIENFVAEQEDNVEIRPDEESIKVETDKNDNIETECIIVEDLLQESVKLGNKENTKSNLMYLENQEFNVPSKRENHESKEMNNDEPLENKQQSFEDRNERKDSPFEISVAQDVESKDFSEDVLEVNMDLLLVTEKCLSKENNAIFKSEDNEDKLQKIEVSKSTIDKVCERFIESENIKHSKDSVIESEIDVIKETVDLESNDDKKIENKDENINYPGNEDFPLLCCFEEKESIKKDQKEILEIEMFEDEIEKINETVIKSDFSQVIEKNTENEVEFNLNENFEIDKNKNNAGEAILNEYLLDKEESFRQENNKNEIKKENKNFKFDNIENIDSKLETCEISEEKDDLMREININDTIVKEQQTEDCETQIDVSNEKESSEFEKSIKLKETNLKNVEKAPCDEQSDDNIIDEKEIKIANTNDDIDQMTLDQYDNQANDFCNTQIENSKIEKQQIIMEDKSHSDQKDRLIDAIECEFIESNVTNMNNESEDAKENLEFNNNEDKDELKIDTRNLQISDRPTELSDKNLKVADNSNEESKEEIASDEDWIKLEDDATDNKNSSKNTDWSEPLGLPMPVMPDTSRKPIGKLSEGSSTRSNSNFGSKFKETQENTQGYYLDIAYVPVDITGNVDSSRVSDKFFTRVRANCYILPGLEHDVKVLNSIILGKNKWNNKEKQAKTNIILMNHTNESKTWILENSTKLSELNIHFNVTTEQEYGLINVCKYIYSLK